MEAIMVQKTSNGIWPWMILNEACISISNLPENMVWQTHKDDLRSEAWGLGAVAPLATLKRRLWCQVTLLEELMSCRQLITFLSLRLSQRYWNCLHDKGIPVATTWHIIGLLIKETTSRCGVWLWILSKWLQMADKDQSSTCWELTPHHCEHLLWSDTKPNIWAPWLLPVRNLGWGSLVLTTLLYQHTCTRVYNCYHYCMW
jgi:hypothetical protein